MEYWKAIPGFSRYEASNLGRLRSLNYKESKTIKVLKPALSGGYFKTMLLSDDGKYYSWMVHKWIALAWLGPRLEFEVNHKNGVKTDNNALNLEYCTRSQNIQHAFDNGLMIPRRGTKNNLSKLTEQQVKEIRHHADNFKGRYYGRKELAFKYGVSECTIKEVVTRRRDGWSHV
jgi:hypothetical protein